MFNESLRHVQLTYKIVSETVACSTSNTYGLCWSPAAPLPVPLLGKVPRELADGLSAYILVGDPEVAPGSNLSLPRLLWSFGEQPVDERPLSLSILF